MTVRPVVTRNFHPDSFSTPLSFLSAPDMADISFTLIIAAFSLFSLIYVAAVLTFKRFPALNLHTGLDPYKAASRITAITHSSCLLPFVAGRLLSLYPHFPYLAANTALDCHVMAFSFAYFAQDILHFVLVEPNDTTLLAHHIVCITFYTSVLHAHIGGTAMLAAVLMGEVTNPLQCVWYLSKLSSCTAVYQWVSPIFTGSFLVVRVLVVPVWVVDIVRGYVEGWRRGELGGVYAVCWSAMSVAMMLGSWVWSWQLLTGYMRMRAKRGRVTPGEKRSVGGDEFASVVGASSKYE